MEYENQENTQSQIRVAFIGISNSGKTVLCSILSSSKNLTENIKEEEKQNSNSKINEYLIKNTSEIKKDIKLLDMSGNDKFGKITLYGMYSLNPDYCVVISANMGLTLTTKEFFEIAIPLIFVITKYNITPDFINEDILNEIQNIIIGDGINKNPKFIFKNDDILSI